MQDDDPDDAHVNVAVLPTSTSAFDPEKLTTGAKLGVDPLPPPPPPPHDPTIRQANRVTMLRGFTLLMAIELIQIIISLFKNYTVMNRHSKQCSPHEDYHGTKNEESKIEIVTICIF